MTTKKAPVPKTPQKRAPFKQTPADSTREAFDKELDRRGYGGSPNKRKKPDYSKHA